MYYHVMCSRDGIAYAHTVADAVPVIIPAPFLFAGCQGWFVTDHDGYTHYDLPEQIVKEPEVLYHMAGHFYKIRLEGK